MLRLAKLPTNIKSWLHKNNCLDHQKILLLVSRISITCNCTTRAHLKDQNTVALAESPLELLFDFQADERQNSGAILYFKYRILQPMAVTAEKFGKMGPQFIVGDIVRDE